MISVPSSSLRRIFSPQITIPIFEAGSTSAKLDVSKINKKIEIATYEKAIQTAFREVADDYLRWLADVKGAKPATLRDHRSVLGESGVRYRRGEGETAGYVMDALGDRPAAKK